MNEKIIFIFIFVFVFTSCTTSRLVSDITDGTREYRELQSEIRNGETELAITGSELESTSKDIEGTINNLESAGSELEQSIGNSTTNEQSIGEILQQIRARKIPADILSEFRNRIIETENE